MDLVGGGARPVLPTDVQPAGFVRLDDPQQCAGSRRPDRARFAEVHGETDRRDTHEPMVNARVVQT